MAVVWIKHKYAVDKFAKKISSKGGGNSGIRKVGRRKLSAAEKSKLPVQPELTMYVGPSGKRKMVKVD